MTTAPYLVENLVSISANGPDQHPLQPRTLRRHRWLSAIALAGLFSTAAWGAPLTADITGFKPNDGMQVAARDGILEVEWKGTAGQNLRMKLEGSADGPVIRELSLRAKDGSWKRVLDGGRIEYSVVEGYRRISNQQLEPLHELGVEVTDEVLDRHRWDVFWDAPLDMRPLKADGSVFVRNPPPAKGIASQPGLPRKPEEIRRGNLRMTGSSVVVTGGDKSVQLRFPSMELGTFRGDLVISLYEGTNLVQTEVVAATDTDAVAYKYDAGIAGVATTGSEKLIWNDISKSPQSMALAADRPTSSQRSLVRAANRVLALETAAGAVGAFTPPHVWYWAREIELNLGNNYYRKDTNGTVAFGIGQAEKELDRFAENWSLYSAPPKTVQRMRAFFYPALGNGQDAIQKVLEFTNGDKYPEVAGHKRMGSHYHIDAGRQWLDNGVDFRIDDFDALRGAGLDIVSLAERPRKPNRLKELDAAFKGAMLHSDSSFLIIPNTENAAILGGHWDLWSSKHTYFEELPKPRVADQPLVVTDPQYGPVYQIGSRADIMAMAEKENMLVFMPHPRTKGSTGYPDAVKDDPAFKNDRYRGAGWRWGMGLDLSDLRMSGKRALPLLDEMNNWAVQGGYRPKYLQAITETYMKDPGDDIYGSGPLQYIRLAELPKTGDYSPVISAMNRGEYFMSSGEVRLESYGLQGKGKSARYEADISWTFPLSFIEVVWGDGTQTRTETMPATQFGAFGRQKFSMPVDLSKAKWVRFAAWDVAGNGAFTNPVALDGR